MLAERDDEIKARDLPAFLDNGLKATHDMRVKSFTMIERIVLIPIELVVALKISFLIILGLLILSGFIGPDRFLVNISGHGLSVVYAVITSVLAGTILVPIMLPWLPGRAFSTKGLVLGILVSILFMAFQWEKVYGLYGLLESLAEGLIHIRGAENLKF